MILPRVKSYGDISTCDRKEIVVWWSAYDTRKSYAENESAQAMNRSAANNYDESIHSHLDRVAYQNAYEVLSDPATALQEKQHNSN